MRSLRSCSITLSFCLLPLFSHASGVESLHLPLVFEKNSGQVPSQYSYVLHGGAVSGYVFDRGISFTMAEPQTNPSTVCFELVGSSPSKPSGDALLPGKSNYLLGQDQSKWIYNIPQYSRVELKDVYPGISVAFYGSNSELEHDFVLQPGADPSRIAFRLDGVSLPHIGRNGELAFGNSLRFTLRKPVAYQMFSGTRKPVNVAFDVDRDGVVRFKLEHYDKNRSLIIDPVFSFSTYLGGTGSDNALAVATDASGNVYVTGSTTSLDFPLSKAEQAHIAGCDGYYPCKDAFVAKLDPTGSTLIFSTYLGGPWDDTGQAIAVDSNGNIVIAGISVNSGFPQSGAMKPATCSGNATCFFLASLKSDGSALNYAGTIGGGQDLQLPQLAMALDASGNAYLSGVTSDTNFQITPGTLAVPWTGYPDQDMFVLKVDTQGNLVYSTLIPRNAANSPGSSNNQFTPAGLVVDSSGRATVSGSAGPGLPTTNGVVAQAFPNSPIYTNSTAAFALRLNPTATAIDFATYLPGTDIGGGGAIDNQGNFFITGASHESSLPVGLNAYQPTPGNTGTCYCNAGFILKLSNSGNAVTAATYLNGKTGFSSSLPYTVISKIVLDTNGNPYIAGMTNATDFPLLNPIVNTLSSTGSPNSGMVLAGMSGDLTSLVFGSFLNSTAGIYGGSYLGGIAMDSTNHLTVSGYTLATDFPTTLGSVEPKLPPPPNPSTASQHGFVSRIDLQSSAPGVCFSLSSIDFGTITALKTRTVNVTVTNCGSAPLHLSAITSSDPTVAAGNPCGTIAPNGTCVIQAAFTPRTNGQISGTLSFADDAPASPQVLPFTGIGSAPKVVSNSGSSVDFGRLIVGTSGPVTTLFFQNSGNASLSISSVSVSGGDFTLGNNFCTSMLAAQALCPVNVTFAPKSAGSLSGALTIASNDPLSPQFIIPLYGIGDTAYVTPVLSRIDTPTIPVNAGLQNVTILGAGFYPASTVQVGGIALATTYFDNHKISAVFDSSSLKNIGELPVTVSNPSPGGGTSESSPLTPYFSIPLWVSSLIYEPVSKLLYAAIPDKAPSNPDTVIPIDPASGAILTPIPVGKDPNTLAVSADGQYLFVGLYQDHAVQRINLTTKSIEKTYALPTDPSFGALWPKQLSVVPGSSTSFIVSLFRSASPPEDGIALFNDAGLVNYLLNEYSTHYLSVDSFSFTSSGTAIYSLPFSYPGNATFFTMLSVGPSGISVIAQPNTPGSLESPGSLVASDGTILYTNTGGVWDPVTQSRIATLSLPQGAVQFRAASLLPDSSTSRVYFLDSNVTYDQAGTVAVEAFKQTDQSFVNDIAFSALSSLEAFDLTRWATDGFAFRNFDGSFTNPKNNQVVIFRSSLAGDQPYPSPTVTSIYPTSIETGSPGFTLQVAGAGFGMKSLVTWNGSSLKTTYVNNWGLTADVPSSNLATSQAARIAVVNPSPGGSSANLVFTVGNNSSTLVLSSNTLTFGQTAQGISTAPQMITVTDLGSSPVQINGVSFTGDYAVTSSCGSVLLPTSSCQLSVVFTPTASGNRPGTVTILDNSPRGYEAISLSGIGVPAVSFSVPAGASTSITVASGSSATYNLSLSAAAGFSGTVNLSCTGAPQYAGCSVSPGSSNVTSGTSSAVTVTVATQSTITAGMTATSRTKVAGFAALPLFVLSLLLLKRRRSRSLFLAICLSITFSAVIGCGSGGGSTDGGGSKTIAKTPAGTYTLTLKATAGQSTTSQTLTLIVQ